jgi:hypothetical protein
VESEEVAKVLSEEERGEEEEEGQEEEDILGRHLE